jgi:hypothetical protein
MARDLVALQQSLDAIELNRLHDFTRKLNDFGTNFNKMMAGVQMRDFIMAYDLANSMYAKAQRFTLNAKAAVEEAEAIAYLDHSTSYLESKKFKITDESRKRYIDVDPEVIVAKDLYARAVSIETFLKNKMFEFKDALDCIKIMTRDTYLTPHEGMK